jgi:hypothetical protein
MKIKILAAGVVALSCAFSAGAATKVANLGSYTLTYDDATALGGLSSNFSSSDGSVGFSWSLPTSFSVVSVGGVLETQIFALPAFTITANPGSTLSGPLAGFLGNLAFTEVGNATTSASATGAVSVNGGGFNSVGGLLDHVATTAPNLAYTLGYHASSAAVPAGTFTSLSVTDFSLKLSASGGTFSSIASQGQGELKVSFFAAPVPEPETYAMMLAGITMIVTIVRRRKNPDA